MTRDTRIVSFGGLAIVIVMLALVLTCQPPPAGVMSVEEATAFMNRETAIFGEGNLDLIDELYAPEYVRHEVDILDDVVGSDAYRERVVELRTSFPDIQNEYDRVMVAGEYIISTWSVSATFQETYQGAPPTGKPFSHSGVSISHVVDGKIAEDWIYYNVLSPWMQVGYTLAPPAMEEEPAE